MSEDQTFRVLSASEKGQFEQEGFVVVRQLFNSADVDHIRDTMMAMNEQKPIPGCHEPISEQVAADDPLRLFPRILYPHRANETAFHYMLHPKLMAVLSALFDEEPLSAQSMMYFKPPGARGQALHQDNYYLRVEPGTCIAAWVAIDAADADNGGLVVVPGTNQLDIQCPHEADAAQSFFRDEVELPTGAVVQPVGLEPGDVLFFNGSTIHGSYPNRSADRFRRSFICHYVGASSLKLGTHISDDLYDRHGKKMTKEANFDAGPCGTPFAGGAH